MTTEPASPSPEANVEELPRVIVRIAGVQRDLTPALPLNVGDLRRLAKVGMDVIELQSNPRSVNIEMIFRAASYVIRKVFPDTSDADIETLSPDDMSLIFNAMQRKSSVGPTDRPI